MSAVIKMAVSKQLVRRAVSVQFAIGTRAEVVARAIGDWNAALANASVGAGYVSLTPRLATSNGKQVECFDLYADDVLWDTLSRAEEGCVDMFGKAMAR